MFHGSGEMRRQAGSALYLTLAVRFPLFPLLCISPFSRQQQRLIYPTLVVRFPLLCISFLQDSNFENLEKTYTFLGALSCLLPQVNFSLFHTLPPGLMGLCLPLFLFLFLQDNRFLILPHQDWWASAWVSALWAFASSSTTSSSPSPTALEAKVRFQAKSSKTGCVCFFVCWNTTFYVDFEFSLVQKLNAKSLL